MLNDFELAQLKQLREGAAAAPGATPEQQLVGAHGGGHRPRSCTGRIATDPAQQNFTAVAHLYHNSSNCSSVAWEAGLRR